MLYRLSANKRITNEISGYPPDWCMLWTCVWAATLTASNAANEYEFCQWEDFAADCPYDDQVVLIQSAYYGRFILGGRCIDSSYGRMDCGRDVTDIVARNCSARGRCTFPVTSLHASSSSSSNSGGGCPRDLTAHLLVKYTCLKGEEIELAAYWLDAAAADCVDERPVARCAANSFVVSSKWLSNGVALRR